MISMTTVPDTDTRELLSLPSRVGSPILFDHIYQKAMGIQSECEDFTVTNVSDRNFYFSNSCGIRYIPDGSEIRNSKMSRYAMGQLCNKLGVPVRYIEKCFESGMPDLALDNMNSWISEYNKDLFIREYQGTVRGVLSSRYMALDTPQILDSISDVVDTNDYVCKGYFLSPERFHARFVLNEMLKVAGEDLFAGIQIDSSDVGRSTLIVRFMIYKQICTNGLCVSRGGGILFNQKHIGIDLDEFRGEFIESMKRIPVLVEHSVELISEAQKSDSRYAVSTFSESQLKDFITRMKNQTRLSDDGVSKVLSLMQERYSQSRWGLINSITEVAQDYTLDRRVELEKIAGDMLFAA